MSMIFAAGKYINPCIECSGVNTHATWCSKPPVPARQQDRCEDCSRLQSALAAAILKSDTQEKENDYLTRKLRAAEAEKAVLVKTLQLIQHTIDETSEEKFRPPYTVEKQWRAQELWHKTRTELAKTLRSLKKTE